MGLVGCHDRNSMCSYGHGGDLFQHAYIRRALLRRCCSSSSWLGTVGSMDNGLVQPLGSSNRCPIGQLRYCFDDLSSGLNERLYFCPREMARISFDGADHVDTYFHFLDANEISGPIQRRW